MSPGRDHEVAETIHVTGQNFEEARIAPGRPSLMKVNLDETVLQDIVNARAS